MNWVYPDSLHVRSAVWRAQSDGVLARDQLAGRELTEKARATLSLLRAQKLMNQFGAALQRASGKTARQPISVVLLGPLLWSRFEPQSSERPDAVSCGRTATRRCGYRHRAGNG